MGALRRPKQALALVVFALVVAACGTDGDVLGTTSPATSTTTPQPSTTVSTEAPATTGRPTTTDAPFVPSTTQRPDPKLEQARVFLSGVDVLIMESFPVQVAIAISGSLPTPCHELAWRIAQPDDDGIVFVEVFSRTDPDRNCIQVLEPFEDSITLGTFPAGEYTIYVNGEPHEISV